MLYTSDSFSAVWPMFMIQGALMLNHWGNSLACLSGYICQLSFFMNSIMTWGLSMDRASPPGGMGPMRSMVSAPPARTTSDMPHMMD